MKGFYIIFSAIIGVILSCPTNAMQDVMKSVEKQAPRLIRSIVPQLSFTTKDLKVDERQKILLKNARPLNSEKNIYELVENARKETFYRDQFSLVTKHKPAFIDRFPRLNFLNSFFDNRIMIRSPISYPFSAISYLEAIEPRDNRIVYWRGSGFLIGPRVLLTAKHCVESSSEGKDKNISFNALFGKTGSSELFDTKVMRVHKHSRRDIALVLLDQDIGLKVGALSLSKDFKEKRMVSVLGYPGVKTLLSYFRNSGETEMYGMVGPLLTISDGKVTYSLDTSGGQSGGPISDILTQELQEYSAYGVHTKGATGYNIGEAYDDDFEEFVLAGESRFLDFLGKHPEDLA